MDYCPHSFTLLNIPTRQLQAINIMSHVILLELSSFL